MSPAHRSAFTLVEVMLVFATVLTLAGLLVPAIVHGHAFARRLACTANQRQVGVAVLTYAGDHDDCLPAVRNWGDNHPGTSPAWFFRLPDYIGQRDVKSGRSVFQCPSFHWNGPVAFTNATPKSYKMNARLDQDGRARHYRLGTFSREHELVLFVDGVAKETGTGQWGHCPPSAVDDVRHRGRVNVLAMDGHSLSTVRRTVDQTWEDVLRWVPVEE